MFVCGKMPCANQLSFHRMVSPVVPYCFVFVIVPDTTHLSWTSGNGLHPQLINNCINGWDKTGVSGTWNLVRGFFYPIDEPVQSKPAGAEFLTSVTPRGSRYKIENTPKWDYLPPDDNPATYDPMAKDYDCITATFEASLSSPRVLLDTISLPADGCARIADGI